MTYWDTTPYHLSYGYTPEQGTPVSNYAVPTERRSTHWAEQTLAIIHGINELGFDSAVEFEFEHSLGRSRFMLTNAHGYTAWREEPLDWEPDDA